MLRATHSKRSRVSAESGLLPVIRESPKCEKDNLMSPPPSCPSPGAHRRNRPATLGKGAQKAALAFARLCAKAGNGLWTVEIIPSEIRPPPHTIGSASGNRIRLAERSRVTNGGNRADVVLAFNEMALLSRLEAGSLADDVLVLNRRSLGHARRRTVSALLPRGARPIPGTGGDHRRDSDGT